MCLCNTAWQGFSNIYKMYLVSPANNSPIGPQIERKRLRHSCFGCYFAALPHNAERLLSSCKRVRDRETDCRGSRGCYFRKHCFSGGIACFLQAELCEVSGPYSLLCNLLKLRIKTCRCKQAHWKAFLGLPLCRENYWF